MEYVQVISDALGLSPKVCLAILGLVGGFVVLLTVNQILATVSATKQSPAAQSAFKAKEGRRRVRDRFLITGPAFAGKTRLYYKLMGGDIAESVSSSDVNESASAIQVKVPMRLL